MEKYIPLFQGVIWPIVIVFLVIIFRAQLEQLIKIIINRIQQGDKLSAFGVAIEQSDPKLGLPSVSTSKDKDQLLSNASLILTGTDKNKSLLVVIGETSPPSGFEVSGLVGIGDALAMAAINSMFSGHPDVSIQTSVIRLRYAHNNQLLELNPNIISIGGHSLSHMIMDDSCITLKFQGMAVFDQRSGKIYNADLRKDYLSGRDWGILLSVPNPLRNGRILVLAGIYGYGTYGSAVLLSKIKSYPLLMDMATKSSFEALVQINFAEGIIRDTNLVFAREFENKLYSE